MASKRKSKKTAKFEMKAQGLNEIDNLSKESPKKDESKTAILGADRNFSVLHREKSTIPEWRQALRQTEQSVSQYYRVIRLFRELDLDAEVTSLKNLRWNNILSRNFRVLKNGEESEELTEYFKKDWFHKFQRETLESILWGYTIFQLGDIENDKLEEIISHKREFFNPKTNELLERYTDIEGKSIDEGELSEWFFKVSPYTDLNDYQGTYAKIAPYQVNLKNSTNAFADYLDRYGSPQAVVSTEMSDEENLRHVEGYLKNLQNASYAIIGQSDELQLIEASGQGADSFATLMNDLKSSIAKLILGNDTINSEKSFVGSAEISAMQSHLFALEDIKFVENTFKKQLVPMLVGLGLTFLEGAELEIIKDDKLTDKDTEMILELVKTGKYHIPAEFLAEKLGVPVEDVEQPTETIQINENRDVQK